MARVTDMEQWMDELVEAHSWGEEGRARALLSRLGERPRKARALLEASLQEPDAQVRKAAAFGLGELGSTASVKRLEQQLALEEARGDFDGASVAEEITLALGRIEEHGARASLARRLERLVEHASDTSEVNTVAYALWRRRHPDLIPVVQRSLERRALPVPNCLQGLLILLEKSPEELSSWASDVSVSVEHKTGVLALLEEELPEAWVASLPAFISAANALRETDLGPRSNAEYYCDRLFSLLLGHHERVLPVFPEALRSDLRDVARKVIVATGPDGSVRAASLLQFIGQPGDAAFLEAHRPAEPILAEVFDRAARALRGLQKERPPEPQ